MINQYKQIFFRLYCFTYLFSFIVTLFVKIYSYNAKSGKNNLDNSQKKNYMQTLLSMVFFCNASNK